MYNYLKNREEEMLLLLERLVNIDSGSRNKAGIDEIGDTLKKEFINLGYTIETITEAVQGNHLVVRHKNATTPEIMIVAHMDTVFGTGTAAQRPFKIEEGRAYGPGVIDMKASHVTVLFAIKALIEKRLVGPENVLILLTSDEEIGSPTSRRLIEEQVQGKKYALVMEPARQDGSLVTARRGAGEMTIHVKGVAAHAGIAPQAGRSAIEELARKVIKFHKLSDADTGIHVNVGLIEGGSTVNTVAPTAVAHVDLRFSEMEQAEMLEQQVRAICATPDIEGTSIEVFGGVDRPPMVKSEQTIELLKVIKEVGNELNIEIKDVATGGSSDASFTSAQGIATIDGLGPIGGHAHTEHEYMEVASLVERTALLANVILRLTK